MFTQAITRKPGKNFADGITTAELGKPDFEKPSSNTRRIVTHLKNAALMLQY